MKIIFNQKQCIGCLCCMTIKEFPLCSSLIDSYRHGGPHFGEKTCNSLECTKCIDICPGHALILYEETI